MRVTIRIPRQDALGLFADNELIDHVELAEKFSVEVEGKNLAQKNSGKFYTPKEIALPLIKQTLDAAKLHLRNGKIRIIDPFCGDGRLIAWMLPHLRGHNLNLEVHLWDYDDVAVHQASSQITDQARRLGLEVDVVARKVDTFSELFKGWENSFDLVITNPPWEVVKPDPKDMEHIVSDEMRRQYVSSLKDFSNRILRDFPLSKPKKAFGGWGVNLARVGTELSMRLARKGGVVGIVTPSSIFADQNSGEIRKWLFSNNNIKNLNVYPAELRLFAGVDQPAVSFVVVRDEIQKGLKISNYQELARPTTHEVKDVPGLLKSTDYVLPISIATSPDHLDILSSLSIFSKLSDLEAHEGLWIGRELDETNYQSWLSPNGIYPFIKGRDIDRFNMTRKSQVFVNETIKSNLPSSIKYHRIVWRDVSRPTQKRRVIATIVPPGYVAGNSLGVLHVQQPQNQKSLQALLGLLSSFVFEFQLRAHLATAHVSAGVMRRMRIPKWDESFIDDVSGLMGSTLNGVASAEQQMEVNIAKAYGLNRDQFGGVLDSFPKITDTEKSVLLSSSFWNTI